VDYIQDKKDKLIMGGAVHKNHSLFDPEDSNSDDTVYPIIYSSAETVKSKYGIHLLTSTSVTVPEINLFELFIL
jgi:hypothetical protein